MQEIYVSRVSVPDSDLLKATVISLVPFEINETKPGLFPGAFRLAPSKNSPEVLVIGECFHRVYIDADRGFMRVRDPSYEVAEAICHDYINSQIAISPNAYPAITWKPGVWSKEKVQKELVVELTRLRECQDNWYIELVKMADDDWEKTRQHWAISDTQRHAARALGLVNKPYLINPPTAEAVQVVERCKACGSPINPSIVVCPHCRCILDSERYKKLVFAEA